MIYFFLPILFIVIFFFVEFVCVALYDLYHRYIRNIYPFCRRGRKHEK